MKMNIPRLIFLLAIACILVACAGPTPAAPTAPAQVTESAPIASETVETEAMATASETTQAATPTVETVLTPTQTEAPTSSITSTPTTAPAATLAPTAEKTETLGEKLKSHIVFYLIIPESSKHRDACGKITTEPIISKRMRTGDKVEDFQIALNMLFNIGSKYWGAYYNALWDTHFTIESAEYRAKNDYIILKFGGDFPYVRLSSCDKHGIREQIWATWRHYGFKEKTFMVSDGFLIDRLGGN